MVTSLSLKHEEEEEGKNDKTMVRLSKYIKRLIDINQFHWLIAINEEVLEET